MYSPQRLTPVDAETLSDVTGGNWLFGAKPTRPRLAPNLGPRSDATTLERMNHHLGQAYRQGKYPSALDADYAGPNVRADLTPHEAKAIARDNLMWDKAFGY